MITLDYFTNRFDLDLTRPSPIKIFKVNRPIMADCLKELGYTTGAEIGVARGDHSELLLKTIPGLTLYCVDPWEQDSKWPNSWHDEALVRLAPFSGCSIKKKYSTDAARDFSDGSLDFVYIDADHYFMSIAEDICAWFPKVREGGILFGHDFHRSRTCHVSDVVTAYANAHGIDPWFALGVGESKPPPGRPAMDGPYYEFPPSWMFLL